jgi:hypothetical protein
MAKENSSTMTERIVITQSTRIRATPLEVRSPEFGFRISESKSPDAKFGILNSISEPFEVRNSGAGVWSLESDF